MAREFCPTGQMTIDGTILIDADNVSIKPDNGVNMKGTLAAPQAIPVAGMRSVEISADILVTNETPQVKPITAVEIAQRNQIGFEVPVAGISGVWQVTWTGATLSQKLGDSAVFACSWKGHLVETNS